MERFDPDVVAGMVGSEWGLEGTSIGRIRSMLLLLTVPINVVVADCPIDAAAAVVVDCSD